MKNIVLGALSIIPTGSDALPSVDAMDAADGATRRENHKKNNPDAEENEGIRCEGDIIKIFVDKCVGHG